MRQVLGTDIIRVTQYGLFPTLFGGVRLWKEVLCVDWDTNTGFEDGPEYTKWVKCSKEETRGFLGKNA